MTLYRFDLLSTYIVQNPLKQKLLSGKKKISQIIVNTYFVTSEKYNEPGKERTKCCHLAYCGYIQSLKKR